MRTIAYRADALVRHIDPEDFSLLQGDAERLMSANSTASYRVFSVANRSEVTVAPGGPFDVIDVGNAGLFTAGQTVEVVLATGATHLSVVTSVDITAGTVTLTTAPASSAPVGSLVRRIYGTAGSETITMALGGETPRVGDASWWWQALLTPAAFVGLVPGTEVEVESIVVKTAGTGVQSVFRSCVEIGADCA